MANEEIKARLARMIDPVAKHAGFKAVGRADWKTRFPRVWRRDLGNRVVHELSLDAGTWRPFFYLDYSVCVRVPKSEMRAAYLETAIHDVCNHLREESEGPRFNRAFSKEPEQPETDSAAFIREVLEESVFPALDTVVTLRDVVECFRTDRFSSALQYRARSALGLPEYRYPCPRFELPAFGIPGGRLTDSVLRQGKPCLLAVWKTTSEECDRGHRNITRLKKRSRLPVYGIAFEPDQTPETLAKYFLANGNPFDLCGYGLRSGEFDLSDFPLWPENDLPLIYVVDGEGLIVHRHSGAQITNWEFEEVFPNAIAKANTFYDWPVSEWPHTHDRGQAYLPD